MLFAFTEYALDPQHLYRVALCLLVALSYAQLSKHSKVYFLRAVGSHNFLAKKGIKWISNQCWTK